MPRLARALGIPEIDAVLFDAGGTLLRLDYAAIAQLAGQGGFPLPVSALFRAEGAVRIDLDRRAAAEGGVRDRDRDRIGAYFQGLLVAAGVRPSDAEGLAEQVAALHAAENLWRVPLPGAAATLSALRAGGFRTGVVSNADGRAESLLIAAGLADHLEIVVDSQREGVEKPDPEIFHRALSRLSVAPERALYVGDIHAIDVMGARAAGLWAVLIDESDAYAEADCPRVSRLSQLIV